MGGFPLPGDGLFATATIAARPCNVDLCHAFIRPPFAPQSQPKARTHVSTRSRHWPRCHFSTPLKSSATMNAWVCLKSGGSPRQPDRIGSQVPNVSTRQPSPCHRSSVRSMQADLLCSRFITNSPETAQSLSAAVAHETPGRLTRDSSSSSPSWTPPRTLTDKRRGI